MDGWSRIYSSEDALKVELLEAMLHDHDIETNILDKKDQALVMLGSIELYVKDKDTDRAVKLIQESELTPPAEEE